MSDQPERRFAATIDIDELLKPDAVEQMEREGGEAFDEELCDKLDTDARITELEAQLAEAIARAHEAEGYLRITRAKLDEVQQVFLGLQTRYEGEHAALMDVKYQLAERSAQLAKTSRRLEQFASDIAIKLNIPYSPPVEKGECAYLVALENLKEQLAAAQRECEYERSMGEQFQGLAGKLQETVDTLCEGKAAAEARAEAYNTEIGRLCGCNARNCIDRDAAIERAIEAEKERDQANARANIWERNYAACGDKDLGSIIAQKDKNWADYNAAIERTEQAEARAAAAKDACVNLGAEIAMATNALPARRVEPLMDAFRKLEEVIA